MNCIVYLAPIAKVFFGFTLRHLDHSATNVPAGPRSRDLSVSSLPLIVPSGCRVSGFALST